MTKKSLSLIGVILLLFVLQSCQSKPEEVLLKRYFQAINMKDVTTMSTMALEPISPEVESWDIVSASEEVIEPASLPELNKMELELKKKLEGSVVITLDAKDELDDATYALETARTRAAKRAAQKKVNELQAKYDEIFGNHKQLQRDYNEAKAATAREEEITSFSLGAGEVPNIRDLTGDVHSKEVEVKIESEAGVKNYKVYIRRYNLKDEVTNVHRRGRWIIIKFELIS